MWTWVLIRDLQWLNYHFLLRWNYLMCQSWWTIPFFITRIGLWFQPIFLVIVLNLRASLVKTPKCILWLTICGVPPTLGLTILLGSKFSNELLLVLLQSGTLSYPAAFSKISTLYPWHSLCIFSYRSTMRPGRTSSLHWNKTNLDHIHEWRRRHRMIKFEIPDQLLIHWFTTSFVNHISKDIAMGACVTKEQAIAYA